MASKRILIVEDEAIVAMELEDRLLHSGYKVVGIAASGEKAIKIAKKENPDLVLMDIVLKGDMDGVETAEHISRNFNIPIIYLTANSDDLTIQKAKKTGPFGFLLKPFEERDLYTNIEIALYKHQMEMKLGESEAQYRNIFENAPVGIYQSTPDGELLKANPALIEFLGYKSFEELKKVNIKNDGYFYAGARDEFDRMINETGEIRGHKSVWKNANGDAVYVREYAKAIKNDDGSIAYYEGAVEDITASFKADELQTRLILALEQLDEAVMITDKIGRLEYVNTAFEEIYGFKKHEVLGKPVQKLATSKEVEDIFTRLWTVLKDKKSWTGYFSTRNKIGESLDIEAVISPLRNNLGEFTNFVVTSRDVSNEKKLEAQLRQAHKMEAVGLLAGGIAHDFNNILTAINGYAELSLNSLKPETPLFRYLQSILHAGQRAGTLTRQLLGFGRKQLMKPELLNTRAVIEELDSMLQRLIGEDISVEKKYQSDQLMIMADPGQLEQILINLIINARDAINLHTDKASEKKITLETNFLVIDESFSKMHQGAEPGNYVTICVSDTGIGMDEETRDKIFDPFFTTKKVGEGSGLGLAMVYGIVKQNNGNIYVYSEPKKGTTFKIYWPAAQVDTDTAIEKPAEHSNLSGNETLLIVEDDISVLDFICTALESMGYKTISAQNGKEAIKILEKQHQIVDLVVTDVVMPEMGGKELWDELKISHPQIKLLFTSGYTQNHIVHNGTLEEGLDFLHKPYTFPKLTGKIREILDR